MLAKLDEKDGFIAHWKSADIDPIARMDDEASFEEAFEQYIDHVGAQYDTNSGVLTLEVRATDAASAKQFAQTILEYSEERVNELTQREREDRTRYAEEQVEKQEARLTEARRALLQQQSEHAELSPMQEAGASMTIRTQLESDLAHARAQLMQLKSYMTPEAPKVKAAQERVKALSAQIGAEKKRLVDPKGEGGIAKSMAKFDATMLEKEFAETAYRSAMASLEVARADAARQHRYLAVIAPPSVPDEATHPERALGVLTVFIMSFLLMGIGSLLVASVREHARV
jgi:capsular polysaccharide transport system permease protein